MTESRNASVICDMFFSLEHLVMIVMFSCFWLAMDQLRQDMSRLSKSASFCWGVTSNDAMFQSMACWSWWCRIYASQLCPIDTNWHQLTSIDINWHQLTSIDTWVFLRGLEASTAPGRCAVWCLGLGASNSVSGFRPAFLALWMPGINGWSCSWLVSVLRESKQKVYVKNIFECSLWM